MNAFADRRIWLKKILGFRILTGHILRIGGLLTLSGSQISSVFFPAWIIDFVCFELRIAESNLAVCFNFFLPDFRT